MSRFLVASLVCLALSACASAPARTTYTLGPYRPVDATLLDRVAVALRASGYDPVVDPWSGVVRTPVKGCRRDRPDTPVLEVRASREGWLLMRVVPSRPGSRCVATPGENAHVIFDRGLAEEYGVIAARLRRELEEPRR